MAVELKATFFLNGMEGDIVGFESVDNLYPEPEYRVIESASQLKSVYNLILQNLAQIEAECDLKNALEMCHVAISFKVVDKEINFVFLPVFPKNFRISENYSSWVQLKSILKSGDAGSPSRGTAISAFFKHKLLHARTNFLLFVESAPEKYSQSSTILEEASKLLADLKSSPASRSKHDESRDSKVQASERSSQHHNSADLDLYSSQVVQEVDDFILRAEEVLDMGEQSPRVMRSQADELRRHVDILDQKIEIANESTKAPSVKQKLIKSQDKLNQLRETLEYLVSSTRKDSKRESPSNRLETIERQTYLQSTRKQGYASPKTGSIGGLPPRSIAHTKKKSIEFEGLKKFRGDDYKSSLVITSDD